MSWWILLGRILWEICSLPLSHSWIAAQQKEARIWPILHILNASESVLPITCYYAHLCSSVAFFRFGIMCREQTSEQLWHKDSRTRSPFRELSPASLLCACLSSIIKANATSVIQWPWHRSQGGADEVSGFSIKRLRKRWVTKLAAHKRTQRPYESLFEAPLMSISSLIHLSAGEHCAKGCINHRSRPRLVDLFPLNYTSSGAAEWGEKSVGWRAARGRSKSRARFFFFPTCDQMSCRGRGEGAPRLSVK